MNASSVRIHAFLNTHKKNWSDTICGANGGVEWTEEETPSTCIAKDSSKYRQKLSEKVYYAVFTNPDKLCLLTYRLQRKI